MKVKSIVACTWLAIGAVACGGSGGGSSSDAGGGDGSVAGLTLPSNMSVVTAQGGSSGRAVNGALQQRVEPSAIGSPLPGPGTQFATDETRTYVYDPSTDALQTVNMILCLMDQTRASSLVNQGAYIALVDEAKCEQGSNGSSAGSTGASSGSVKQFKPWVVRSTRADNASPQIVHIWVPPYNEASSNVEDQGSILVELTATEGVSTGKPFGSFSMAFRGVVDASALGGSAGSEVQTMVGSLRTTGDTQFEFYNDGGIPGDFEYRRKAVVNLADADGTSGNAKTYSYESGGWGTQEGSYAVAFNASNFARALDNNGDNSADASQCLARNEFNTQVWRYNLYDAASGNRVVRNSGFPFQYATGADTINGFVGYHGLWAERDTAIPDGATIQKVDYSTGDTTPYTVHVGAGKLIRRTANSLTLDKLVGESLMFWGTNPSNSQMGQWEVKVNASTFRFEIVSSVSFGASGPTYTPVTPAVDITPSSDGTSLFLWGESLGGNIVYVRNGAPSAASAITFYGQETVYPNDAALAGGMTLKCYDRCLKGGLTDTAVSAQADLFYPSSYEMGYAGPYLYGVAVSGGKLIVTDQANSQPVDASGLSAAKLQTIGQEWGIQSSEMVLSSVTIANPWEVYDQGVTYRWETGVKSWNQLVTVSSGGVYATFDKPIQMTYTVEAGDERNGDPHGYAGKTLRLSYDGAGQLHGFPWKQDGDTNRWSSSVTLKDGVLLTDGTSNYIVKAIEGEQTMQLDANPSACAGLDTAAVFAAALPNAPYATVGITLAGKPVVTDAPKVIDGELQQ
jgi:hypothetical protein